MCYPPTAILHRLTQIRPMIDMDKVLGALLGGAVGDALGMPVDGLSHQNVRTYYKGIKGLHADTHRRDLDAGQWTAHTQRATALARALASTTQPGPLANAFAAELDALDLRRNAPRFSDQPHAGAATAAAPLGLWWALSDADAEHAFELVTAALGVTHAHPAALAAGFGQAFADRMLLEHSPDDLDGPAFFRAVTEQTDWAEARLGGAFPSPAARLRRLADHLVAFPLDLQDLCGGTDDRADEAWPFAVAMLARNPTLVEATILPAVNVGGAASAVGSLVGSLVGALHGWQALPAEWRDGLEDIARLEAGARTLAGAMRSS